MYIQNKEQKTQPHYIRWFLHMWQEIDKWVISVLSKIQEFLQLNNV